MHHATQGIPSPRIENAKKCLTAWEVTVDLSGFKPEGSKNKPQLTPAGQTLGLALSAALDSMEAAVRAVSDDACGTLDVACFSTFTVKWLIPRLFAFNA